MSDAEVMEAVEPVEETPSKEAKAPGKMSREELDKFLSEEPEEPESTDEGEEDNKEEPESSEPEVKDEGEEPEKGIKESPEYKELEAKLQALEKKAVNQDKFFDRIGTEIGLLRKRTPEEDKEELERVREAFIEDPKEGKRLMEQYLEKQHKSENVQREYELAQRAKANKEALSSQLPDLDKPEMINELAELMAEDGAPAQAIEVFKTVDDAPFIMDGATLINLYKRNQLRKENSSLKEQMETLQKENEELKKKPGKMLENLEKATKTSTLTNKGGEGKKAPAEKVDKSPDKMSKEELDKILNGG